MGKFESYTDESLVFLLKEGNTEVFTEIYNRYWDKLYFVAHKRLKNSSDAEEIVQTVFSSLWQKRESLDIKVLGVYLSAMTRYAVYKFLASEKRKQEIEHAASAKLQPVFRSDAEIDHREVLALVHKMASALPEKCRLIFIHNKLLDQPLDEVARAMDISIKTAEAHITKALKIVRSKLGNSMNLFLL